MERQVKSKQRVADHGEVFTADREVQAMCDLVKQETDDDNPIIRVADDAILPSEYIQ